jgi:adenosylcobinamide-GDP ribazoletransferase
VAVGFLTVVPVRLRARQPGDLARGAVWFPVVGLALGALLLAAHSVFRAHWGPALSAGLVVALWAALTGGLHLDGLADSADGLLASAPPERRLEILRDPRRGSFAMVALSLTLILKTAALAEVPQPAAPLLLGPALARWLLLILARRPRARREGMAVELAAGLTGPTILIAAPAPVLAAIAGGARGLLGLLASGGVVWAIGAAARKRLGGITGDVLGLSVEAVELAVLLVASEGGFSW